MSAAYPYYRTGHRYMDTTTLSAPVEWLCTTSGYGAAGVAASAGTAAAWAKISGGGSVSTYTFVSDAGDYIICTPSGGGSNVNIAKPYKLRTSITTETYIDGTGAHTYTYAAVVVSSVTVSYTRANTWAGGSQTEYVTESYLPGDLVYAIGMPSLNMPTSPGSGSTAAVTLLDIHTKHWAVQ